MADRVSLQLQIESFQNNEREVSHALRVVRESFTEAKHEALREVARFSEERAQLHGQVGPQGTFFSGQTTVNPQQRPSASTE